MKYLYWLLLLAPIAIAAEFMHAAPLVVFSLSALAIVPLSGLLGAATEELAGHTGPTIGGLLNATLGNLAELIIAVLALRAGMIDLVKASITGSILGNLLLVLGAAQLAGGLRYKVQRFNPALAGMSVSLLMIAVIGLVVPSIFFSTHPDPAHVKTVRMSEFVAGALILGYLLSLLYSMGTHKAVFGEGGDIATGEAQPHWSLKRSVAMLLESIYEQSCVAGLGTPRDSDENRGEGGRPHGEERIVPGGSDREGGARGARVRGVARDGVRPPRIRMTRGALAHMYVKGELYPQAISEIRSVLKEDPGRTDMEALLARAHYRSGQKNEAVEVASSLLRRYPLCLDANAVLVDILGADKLDSVQENRQRVIELDPYAAHVSGSILDSSGAPDSAVSLERLDWSGQSVSMPSDWRETRGISLQAASPEEPEWLTKSLAQTETTPPPAGEAELRMDAPAQPESEIPEFLSEAGWGKSTGAFDESKASLMSEEETLPPTAAAPLTAGEMPDWIKALAPTETDKPESDEPMPDWMNRIDPSILPSASEQPAASDQPNWLKGLGQPEETSQPVPAFGDEPDWLKGLGDESGSSAPTGSSDELDFLNQLKAEPQESQPPSTLTLPAMDTAAPGTQAQAEDDAFAWLESLAVKQGSTEGLLVKPEDRLEEEPDWVKQAKSLSGGMEIPTTPLASEPVEQIPAAPVGGIERQAAVAGERTYHQRVRSTAGRHA